jgi:integrase
MASITNRSNYVVTVEGQPERTRRFAFNNLKEAKRYQREQKKAQEDGKKPGSVQLVQLEDNLLVRVRDRGYPKHTFNATSYEDAENQLTIILADRVQGRRIDFNKARTITLAKLFDRYIDEVCPRHKGCQTETYKLNSFLEDVGYESQYAKRQRALQAQSDAKPGNYKKHIPRQCIEWVMKPFADVMPTDFQSYVSARLKQGIKPATIDREFDLISQVVNWAMETLRYHLEINPFVGFERPRYFNERDRRLRGDEGERLLAAVREEDRIRSFNIAVEQELERIRAQGAPRANKRWNKYFTMKARKQARAIVTAAGFLIIPFWEALFEYLLATASRRSEALSLAGFRAMDPPDFL